MTESPNLNQKLNLDFISSSEISEVFCFIFQNSNALVLGCFWLKDKSCKTFDIIMSTKSVFFSVSFDLEVGGRTAAQRPPFGFMPEQSTMINKEPGNWKIIYVHTQVCLCICVCSCEVKSVVWTRVHFNINFELHASVQGIMAGNA